MFYFDFEYRNNKERDQLVLLSAYDSKTGAVTLIDLRDGQGQSEVDDLVVLQSDNTWIAYNADADLTCLLTLGVDIRHLKVIDAMAEAQMIMLSHRRFFSKIGSLVVALKKFKLKHEFSSEEKDKIRDIILGNKQYTDSEWELIKIYGEADVTCLKSLMGAIRTVHKEIGTSVTWDQMRERGQYIKASTTLHYFGRGFPVDIPWMDDVYNNKDIARNHLAEEVNKIYGQLFVWNKTRKDYSFKQFQFDLMITNQKLDWARTKSGRQRKTDKQYFGDKCTQYPHLGQLLEARRTRDALKGTNLRGLASEDGYIKAGYRTFNQVTGRTSPLPTKGQILNLTPWMRSFIKPKNGKVVIGVDWSQQEIAIGAVLSGDTNLLAVYQTGDVYTELAKRAGAIPKNGDKKDYPLVRQAFKAVQLGINYGKGLDALAEDIFALSFVDGKPTISISNGREQAEDILSWHKEEFCVYWEWVSDNILNAYEKQFIQISDGWTSFVDADTTLHTQLKNFPMQATGAAMMRNAVINVYNTQKLDLICSLHDALYVNSTVESKDGDLNTLVGCMNLAVEQTLGAGTFGLVRTDVKILEPNNNYFDARGVKQLAVIKNLIQQENKFFG